MGDIINPGDYVIDKVTGFSGVVISKHIYLHGCNRITVQSTVKDGQNEIKEWTFDEPQLELEQKSFYKK